MSLDVPDNKARNRWRNIEQDKIPLLQEMQDEKSVALKSKLSNNLKRKLQKADSNGEPFHVILNIGELPTSIAQTSTNLINTIQNSSEFSGDFDDKNLSYIQNTYPHSSEDVMALEANFDGGAHVPFIYPIKEDKIDEFTDSEDENKKKFGKGNFYDEEVF